MSGAGWAGWFRSERAGFSGELLENEPLARHTYYRIGGPAAVIAAPRTIEDLAWLARGLKETGARSFILGAGTNILAADEGFDGVVVRTAKLDATVAAGADAGIVRAGPGLPVSSFLRHAAREGWDGLAMLSGIPGSMGGAVAMNAGTHLGETQDRVSRVRVYSLSAGFERMVEGGDLRFEYRHNLFLKAGDVVLESEWRVSPGDPAQVRAEIDAVLARRKATQPLDAPSCGSVFKNPRSAGPNGGLQAWQVVDRLGLRGRRIGGAQVSEKHSNWIVNRGGAKAADVRALITMVKERAKAELGIEMEEEVRSL